MSDHRPSISELRQAYERDTFTDEAKLIAAIPVLLEIVTVALTVDEQGGISDSKAGYHLRAALAKVRR